MNPSKNIIRHKGKNMKKRHFRRYLAFILAFSLIFQVDLGITNAKEAEKEKVHTTDEIRDMYNMAVLVRFDGEDEYLNDQIPEANNTTNIQLIENTYNNSIYSVQEYYKSVSNHTVNIKTVYLTEAKDGFSSIKLNHSRGYYSPKSADNPEGYTNEGELRRVELVRDWSAKVKEAIANGAVLKNFAGEEIDFSKLDSDGDQSIDCITLLFSPTDAKYAAEWGSPLWAYETENYLIDIETSAGTLTSKRYYQAPIQNNPLGIYKEPNGDTFFSNTSTLIHEMGHIFGLLDLYSFSGNNTPVYYMSSMAKALSPVVQFMTSREREAAGWLNAENITPITKAGTYTLPPVKDIKQNGTVAYTLELPNEKRLYLEYRYVEDLKVNRFDFDTAKRVLFNSLGLPVKAIGLNKSGLLICDVNMNRKFPSNSGGTPQLSVIGGQYSTRIDAPRTKGESITYGGYTISVINLDKEKITFKVTGNGLENEQQPENSERPATSNVKLLAPVGIGEELQLTAARGSEIQFLAETEGKKFSDGDMLWTVKGGSAADTEIGTQSGLLKIGNFESAESVLKVVGRSEEDSTKSITINVKVAFGTKSYAVTYLPGADSIGKIDSAQKMHDTGLRLKDALYTKDGFVQTGWSLKEGGEKVYDLNAEYNKNCSVLLYPFWSKSENSKLTGSVAIQGKLEYGQTLYAMLQGVNSTEVIYQWKRQGKVVGNGQNYVLSANDIGHVIECQVQARDKEGTLSAVTKTAIERLKTETILTAQVENGSSEYKISMAAQVKGVHTEIPSGTIAFYNGNVKLTEKKLENGRSHYTWSEVKKGNYDIRAEYQPSTEASGCIYKSSSTSIKVEVIEKSPSFPAVSPKPSIVLSAKSMVLDTAGTKKGKLTVQIIGAQKKAVFKSSNPKTVTVNHNGNLTAIKAGEATITATANGVKAHCKVVVKTASVKLNHTSMVLYIPEKKVNKLIADVSGVSKKAIFKSNNTRIVKVDAVGKLTAIKEGKTTITATANGRTAICNVEVKKISLSLNQYASTIYVKGKNTIQLKPVVIGPSKKVTYKSSNPKIAKVNSTGKITAAGKGTAFITISANGLEKKYKVTVLPAKK